MQPFRLKQNKKEDDAKYQTRNRPDKTIKHEIIKGVAGYFSHTFCHYNRPSSENMGKNPYVSRRKPYHYILVSDIFC